MTPAILAEGLSKRFRFYRSPWLRLAEWALLGQARLHEAFWALDGVRFRVEPGESVGVLGRNGAGKSTLLKILAGCLAPTEGRCEVRGRVASLLELGTGFHPELTGRQNIGQVARLLALDERLVARRHDEIAAFADIGEFLDRPVKTYSTGMFVRLAFSIFTHLDPEVFLVDEALAVGDVFFQQKCYERLKRMREEGRTLLLVTHDTAAVSFLCPRAILLDQGRVLADGDSKEVVSRYLARLASGPAAPAAAPDSPAAANLAPAADAGAIRAHDILPRATARHGAGDLVLEAARATDGEGRDALQIERDGTLAFHLLLAARRRISDPSTGIHLFDRFGNLVFAAGTRQLGVRLPDLGAGESLVVRLELRFSVQPGDYTFSLGCAEPAADANPNVGFSQDRHEGLGPIRVTADPLALAPFYGIARLPLTARFERARTAPAASVP